MCLDNIFLNKKKQKVEILAEDFEELVKAYAELKDLKAGLEKMRFLSGLSYEELSKINWTSFEYLPDSVLEEESSGVNAFKVRFEGEFVKRG